MGRWTDPAVEASVLELSVSLHAQLKAHDTERYLRYQSEGGAAEDAELPPAAREAVLRLERAKANWDKDRKKEKRKNVAETIAMPITMMSYLFGKKKSPVRIE